GTDPSESDGGGASATTAAMLMSFGRRIHLVRIGDDVRATKKVEFTGSVVAARRGSFACTADSRSYALVDIDRRLKIPLMTISSLDDSQPAGVLGQAQSIAGSSGGEGVPRGASSSKSRPASGVFEQHQQQQQHGHGRSTSLSGLIAGGLRRTDHR